MPAMPYMFEVGRILSWVNEYLETPDNAQHLFDQLHAGVPLTEIDALNSPNPENATIPDPVVGGHITPAGHVARDWLGWQNWKARLPAGPQPPFNPAAPNRTGWWVRWNGNAEGVIRETLLCATEVALNYPRGKNVRLPKAKARHWRMQFLWVCGAPFLQGWVNWQEWDKGDRDGMVTVTFTTPGNGHPLYATPEAARVLPAPDNADYEVNPQTVGEYGLWVIGEDRCDVLAPPKAAFFVSGAGFLPPMTNQFIHTSGNVIVVSPQELDGGVRRIGRDWQ
jgi:hypothetical protein